MYRRNRWLPVLGVILVLGILLQLDLLVALSTALLVVLSVATWWQKHALDGVTYRRKLHYKRGFPEEKTQLQLEVENRKLLPLSWLRTQDPWARAVGPEDDEVMAPSHIPDRGFLTNVFSLRWYERARRSYILQFRKRGIYQVGPARLDSGDLFGFYEQTKEQGPVEYLTVFPSLLPLKEIDLPAEDPFGDRRSRRRLFEDPESPNGGPGVPTGRQLSASALASYSAHWSATSEGISAYFWTGHVAMSECVHICQALGGGLS